MELQVEYCEGSLKADGKDEVGEFRLSGGPCSPDGLLICTKEYAGKHSLHYRGELVPGVGITGEWSLGKNLLALGAFALWPGQSPAPPPEIESNVPKPPGVPGSVFTLVNIVSWILYLIGVVALPLIAIILSKPPSLLIFLIGFSLYLLLTGAGTRFVARKLLRNWGLVEALPRTSWRTGLKKPVSAADVWTAVLIVASLLATAWVTLQKK